MLFAIKMRLTWGEFFDICQAEKPNNFKPPNWDSVKSVIVEKLGVIEDDAFTERLSILRNRYGKFIKLRNSKSSDDRSTECHEVVLNSEELSPVVVFDEKPPIKK